MTIYDAAAKTNVILVCTSRKVLSRSRKTIPLYSELVRTSGVLCPGLGATFSEGH